MTTWTYGEAGERYPVEPEDIWRVGRHWIGCSDLMDSSLLDTMVAEYGITLLYCDPPWGQALVNGFRTKAGLGKASYRWEELYHRIAELGHSRRVPVWIEGSKQESRDGQKIPDTIAHRETREFDAYFPTTYYGRAPSGLYYAGTVPHPVDLDGVLEGMDDAHTPGTVMTAYEPGIVVDPCLGLGGTAVAAERAGWASVCNEMSTYRTSGALAALAELVGEEPMKL